MMMIATILCLLALVRFGCAQDTETPETRFTQWDTLSKEDYEAAMNLGYDEESWGFLLENPIEAVSYEENRDDPSIDGYVATFEDEVAVLGISEEQWDCWISHYNSYGWEELELETQEAWEDLGWNVTSWETGENLPDTEEKFWADLTPTEETAATYLCYFEEIWDEEESINDFGSEGPGRSCNIFCFIWKVIRSILDFFIFWK